MEKYNLESILAAIKQKSEGDFSIVDRIQGDLTIQIPLQRFKPIIDLVVYEMGCKHLSGITVQTRKENPGEIEMMYHFWIGEGFSLLISLPAESPKIPEIFSILPGADFYEREAAEMFGIQFIGRENIPPLLLPDGWNGGPPFIRSEEIDEKD
jgi:NADH:ubiquinone oxidoreductase subunit C